MRYSLLVLKIILVILLLIALLCLTRVRVRAEFRNDTVTVDAGFGLIRFRVYPRPPHKEKKAGKKRKPDEEAAANKSRAEGNAAKGAADKKEKKKPDMKELAEMIRSATEALLPPMRRSLARMGRGICIRPLSMQMILGAEDDPAAGAQLYGEINAAVWTVMPVLEELADIREPYIRTDVDFNAGKTVLSGEVGVSIRVGTLLAAAFGIGIPAIRWFYRQQKKKQKQNTAAAAADAAVGQ